MMMLDLVVENLRSNPIWEFSDYPDEVTTVHPVSDFDDLNTKGYIAFTRFILRDGSEFWGYCSPCDDSGLDYVQPTIIVDDEHARLWYDDPPQEPEPQRLCRLLNRELDAIFPIRFECQVAFEGKKLIDVVSEIGGNIAT